MAAPNSAGIFSRSLQQLSGISAGSPSSSTSTNSPSPPAASLAGAVSGAAAPPEPATPAKQTRSDVAGETRAKASPAHQAAATGGGGEQAGGDERARLEEAGKRVRAMKADGDAGLSAAVTELNALKAKFAPNIAALADIADATLRGMTQDHAGYEAAHAEMLALCALLPKKDKKARDKKRKNARAEVARTAAEAFDRTLHTKGLRIQRKIPHLLRHGGSGDTFWYGSELDVAAHGMHEGSRVYVTDKWDGTTVQATREGVFQRRDLHRKGDSAKFGASEAERYGIERLNPAESSNLHIMRALKPHMGAISRLEPGLCVYFEAVGQNISGSHPRYSGLDGFAAIRVFDFSRHGEYLPFAECLRLCESYGLPPVRHRECELRLTELLGAIRGAPRHHDLDAELEGFVVRGAAADTSQVAKIRVADLDCAGGWREHP